MSEPAEGVDSSLAAADLARVRSAVLRELRTRPAPRGWWVSAGGLVFLQLTIAFAAVAGWSIVLRAPVSIGWHSGVLAALVAGATVAAVRPSRRGISFVAALVVAGAATAVSIDSVARAHLVSVFGQLDCALVEIALAVLPAVATLLVLRRFAFSGARALLGGLAVGCTGVLTLDLTCPVGTFVHALAFHLAPCFVVAALVAVIRGRLKSKTFAA